MTQIDMHQIDTDHVYAAVHREALGARLSDDERRFLDARFGDGKEWMLTHSKSHWSDPVWGHGEWTEAMDDYLRALLTLHYARTARCGPIDPTAGHLRRRMGMGALMAARGD